MSKERQEFSFGNINVVSKGEKQEGEVGEFVDDVAKEAKLREEKTARRKKDLELEKGTVERKEVAGERVKPGESVVAEETGELSEVAAEENKEKIKNLLITLKKKREAVENLRGDISKLQREKGRKEEIARKEEKIEGLLSEIEKYENELAELKGDVVKEVGEGDVESKLAKTQSDAEALKRITDEKIKEKESITPEISEERIPFWEEQIYEKTDNKADAILYLVAEKLELLGSIDQKIRTEGKKDQEYVKRNRDEIRRIENKIKILYNELGSVKEIERILGENLNWKKGRLIEEVKNIVGEVEKPKETELIDEVSEDEGIFETGAGAGGEEKPKISREDLERMEKIDDRIEKAERGIEEIEAGKENVEVEREDSAEKEVGDTVKDSLDNLRIVDLKLDKTRLKIDKVEIQLESGELSDEERNKLERMKFELEENKRKLLNEQMKVAEIWEQKLKGALLHQEYKVGESEKKISKEKKSFVNKLTLGLLGGKAAEAAETAAPAGMETPAESARKKPEDVFVDAFSPERAGAGGESKAETPKKGWVYRNLSHREEWKREKKIGRVEERIDGVEIPTGLLLIARDCAKENKFSKETNNFFKEFENYLEKWSRGENSAAYQRKEDFDKLAEKLGELRNNDRVSSESVMMVSAFFDKAKEICLGAGVSAPEVETPAGGEVESGEEGEISKNKEEIIEDILELVGKDGWHEIQNEIGTIARSPGLLKMELPKFLDSKYATKQSDRLKEEIKKMKVKMSDKEQEILWSIALKDIQEAVLKRTRPFQ